MNIENYIFDKAYFQHEWQMENCERLTLLWLVSKIKPKLSIEIGTSAGGSLVPISQYSDRVYSIDVNFNRINKSEFKNVTFLEGDSKVILPNLIDELNRGDNELQFVLVDGDHSEIGVNSDINSILNYKPKQPVFILMHDSFNPECRTGMLKANWSSCKHLHGIEIDFIPGVLSQGDNNYRQMWDGMALAIMLPYERKEEVIIQQSRELQFFSTLFSSMHFINNSYYIKYFRELLPRSLPPPSPSLEEMLESLKQQNQALADEIAQSTAKKLELEEMVESLKRQNKILVDEMNQLMVKKAELEEKVESVNQQNKILVDEMNQQKAEKSNLGEANKSLKQQNSRLEEQLKLIHQSKSWHAVQKYWHTLDTPIMGRILRPIRWILLRLFWRGDRR